MKRWIVGSLGLGVLMVIVIPNLLTAMQRKKQKVTMADIRTIATAIEAYWGDHPDWKPASQQGGAAAVAAFLEPQYIKVLPTTDGWGHPLRLAVGTKGNAGEEEVSYTIWSAGADGKRDVKWAGATDAEVFQSDIVFSNGEFIVYPEST